MLRLKRVLLSLMTMPVLGCGGGPPAAPAAPAPPPDASDAAVIGARDSERQRQRQAGSNTVLTGAQGDTSKATIGVKTLLGA